MNYFQPTIIHMKKKVATNRRFCEMSSLDWTKFNSLAGDKAQNFENLCRALIRLHFGKYGQFSAFRNQPGVEFHLKLSESCQTLGDPPRWYGWQCKRHSQTKSGDLNAASKRDIKDSLEKTEQHLPELTDWVLWTPYTLSRKDQEWFSELQTNFTLHQWTEQEIETYLSGPGLILRGTYFGELIATPEELEQQHRESIQPIRDRWLQPVHQSVDAERTIRRMLGEPGSWDQLIDVGERLKKAVDVISGNLEGIDPELAKTVKRFSATCSAFADTLLSFHRVLADGDLDFIQQRLRERKTLIDREIQTTPRRLSALNLPITLDVTNAMDDIHTAQEMLDNVEESLGVGLVALLADAGGGKTQVAAQLTATQENRPAGVLLHGRNLHRGQMLDDFVGGFSLKGNPLSSMEKLLAAIDAAGKRARCRLPVMIDGLNEAENPKDWKAPLAALGETVKHYPNVLVVCTLRTGEHQREDNMGRYQSQTDSRESFAVMALPDDVKIIESDGFGADTNDAIERYFSHFKIDPGEAEIPVEFFIHPLTLRIFCEVTNPSRKSETKIDYFPASLSSLFEKYVENACERISQMPNLSYSYTAEDVDRAIYKLGLELWRVRQREIGEEDFRKAVSDTDRGWNSSIVNLLTQEGLIFRNPGSEPHEYVITPVYDAFGGFIIARALLSKHINDREFTWLNDEDTIQSFQGEDGHTLSTDIFGALGTLFPRRMYRTQLWKVVPASFRDAALRVAMNLDAEYLDQDTLNAIRELLCDNPKKENRLFFRLWRTRGAVSHPLNADFLDSVLRPMSVAKRDLSWTEWIRHNLSEKINDILGIELKWKENLSGRTSSDRLHAKWLMWLLTSTDRNLRDVATRALYWFGRGEPEALFEETIRSLEINDPYVPERMLAASYGVAMALHVTLQETTFKNKTLLNYAEQLYESLFAKGAKFSTTHCLIRDYSSRTIELAAAYNSNSFSHEKISRSTPPFTDGGLRQWGESKYSDKYSHHSGSPFRMDFENYTIGGLVPDRRNYDYEHKGYRKIRAQILWRIEQLGWSSELFKNVDDAIESEKRFPSRLGRDERKIERYGKKYSWIAYYEMVGLQNDLETINRNDEGERTSDVDIDPSFPVRGHEAQIINTDLLGAPDMETEEWIRNSFPPDMTPYFRLPKLLSEDGPWIMLNGFVTQRDEDLGRSSFFLIRGLIIENQHASSFIDLLNQQDFSNAQIPNKPSVYYTFAGEIPWCSTFPENGFSEFPFVTKEKPVRVQRTRCEFYFNNKKLDQDQMLEIVSQIEDQEQSSDYKIKRIEVREVVEEVDEIEREYASYKFLIPVCDFDWESYHSMVNDAGHATTLAKEISLELDLIGQPQTFDLFTKEGKRATLCISDRDNGYDNNQSIYFISEELLTTYLNNNSYSLIWVVQGDRSSYSVGQPSKSYQTFSFVKRYEW